MRSEALFSLGWQLHRDGVSIKVTIPLVGNKMSNKSKHINNGVNEVGSSSEGLSGPVIDGHDGEGRSSMVMMGRAGHRTTADRRTTRRKWSQEENSNAIYGTKWECLM